MASGSHSSSVLSTELVLTSDLSEEEERHETSGDSRAESETIPLLDRLRASDLARKRKVDCNPPTGKQRSFECKSQR